MINRVDVYNHIMKLGRLSSTFIFGTAIAAIVSIASFATTVNPASAVDDADVGDSEAPAYVVWFPRGDGTKGHYGGITTSATVAQTEWFITDQKARRSLLDDDLSQAENLFKLAIQKAEAKAMYEPGVINSFCGLAFLYHKKSNSAESERVYEYAMRYLEGISGGRDTARFADYLPDLAWLYNAHGKPDSAEVLLKNAVAIRERRFGEYSRELVQSLNDYGLFLKKNGRDTEARHLDARIKLIQNHSAE
ncbi:MAG: tetratricopeptide repeat protein [Candidatus Melainabacteria bacterium]|nr:tetratricopeptide repeat protein [Candidatus Melainabacteria bacterium]